MVSVAWSPDGSRIAAGGSDQIVHLFDVSRGRELVNLHGHIGRVTSLRFTNDGRSLISTSLDGSVRIWDRGDERTRTD
jgi:WD40 repeat protein